MSGSGGDEQTPQPLIEQRLHWTVPVTQPIALCSQIQRSGGTLLQRLFDGHRGCFVHPNELGWGKPKSWPEIDLSAPLHPDALFDLIAENWPRKFAKRGGYQKYSNWTHEHHPEQAQSYPFIFDTTLQRQIFAAAVQESPRTPRDVLNAYLTSLFNAWLDYQNLYSRPKQWVVAFQPRLILKRDGLDRFFNDYPDGLLITIVREPGSWFASYTRHAPVSDPEEALRLWMESTEASLRAKAARPDHVEVVLFEDLVHRTEAVMQRLATRMGMVFDAGLLEPTYNSMPVLSDSSHELATGVDRAVTDRHRTVLSPEELAVIERVASPRYQEVRTRVAAP